MAPNEQALHPFWMIMVEGKNMPVLFSGRYNQLNDARLEAERLAVLPENIGRKVWVLEATSHVEVVIRPITWTYYK